MRSNFQESSRITYKDVVNFILANRGSNAFTNSDHIAIARSLLEHTKTGTVHVFVDKETNKPYGVVVFDFCSIEGRPALYIRNIVAEKQSDAFKQFISLFRQKFPGYLLIGDRYGQKRIYDFFRGQRKN